MASPPPRKVTKISRIVKHLRRRFDHAQGSSSPTLLSPQSPALPGTSTANISNNVQGDRSQGTISKSPPSPQPGASLPQFDTSDKLKKVRSVAWSTLETTLRLLDKSANAFPPLQSAVGGLVACLDLTQAVTENREEYEKLATELTSMASTLTPYVTRLVAEDVSGSVALIIKSIEMELAHINQQQARGKMTRTVEANQDHGDVLQRYRRIEALFRQLQNNVSLRAWEDTRKLRETSLLEKMLPVDDARYNSSYSTTIQRSGCTPETREKVLEDLKGWVVDPKGAKVYWMNGMAGTGKTTILYSLCEWLEENKRLGSNYFCSRISSSCRDVNNIVPTLAYQLARYSPTFRSALCKVLEERPEASKLDVKWQFEKLIQEPMQAVTTAMPENVIVVIDALDECDDGDAFRLFLETLVKLAGDLLIKFLIASRPEPVIREKMLAPGYSHSVLHLHNIESSIVEADIKKYLTDALKAMSPPPSPSDVEQLVKRAGKLFVYAATAMRYIKPGNSVVDSSARLQTVLGMHVSGPTKQHDGLNRLYTSILTVALDTEHLEHQEVDNIRLILNTVVCAKEPMAIQTLASLLSLAEERVRSSLEPLRSILHVQDNIHGLVSPFHASFPDYLLNKLRSGEFYCESAEHNELLANFCFDLMKAQLKFNICKLESSFVFDNDVSDLQKRIEKSISAALSYTCRYWAEHLRQGNSTDQVRKRLVDFLTHRLLFWMEVLNLERRIAIGAGMLSLVRNWLKVSELVHDLDFQNEIKSQDSHMDTHKQVADAEAFITRFTAGACLRSTPHIYISGLPFCPRSNSVYKNYWRHTRGLMDVRGSAVEQWPSAAIAIWDADSLVSSVAVSVDGLYIVSGSDGRTIQILDARTGDTIAGPFEGHTGWVSSVAFSPDGTRIVSGSSDQTIRIWDARTGQTIAGPFTGHTGLVRSVTFSPDETCIVSGSNDHTIRVWDAHTGGTVAGPFRGHTGWVSSVAFSSNGTRIVSGSGDQTIRVWDARTGDTVIEPFKGHMGPVLSVAFSPDSMYIVSSSDDQTIKVWDAHTGDTIGGPFTGHTGSVCSVAFSPNGTRVVSGSDDQTIRVWDAYTGKTVAGPFRGHKGSVRSVAFSPDSTYIISCSNDRSIRVWDASAGNAVTGPFKRHTGSVCSVAFSPDNTCIVSGSEDQTIQVWDAKTGNIVAGPFTGHTGSILSVAFSFDGIYIVSGSDDKTIRVWGARTGNTIAQPFIGHNGAVQSVAFSSDGARVVSASKDRTIRIWDARTGNAVTKPFKGHTGSVLSVAFSPDGTRIISGSNDKTFRVWDASTGNTIAVPLKGYTGSIWSVGLSPDATRFVSGSLDRTMQVWDAHTGDTVSGSFTGHTGLVISVAFSPDSTRIVSGSSDQTVRVWDAGTGNTVAEPFKGHAATVLSVAFSPDGKRIVSGSDDRAIRVWDACTVAGTSNGIQVNDPSVSHHVDNDILSMGSFTFTQNGWITAHNDLLFWISPLFRVQLPYPHNPLVIGPEGTVLIDYSHLCIGKSWSDCYFS